MTERPDLGTWAVQADRQLGGLLAAAAELATAFREGSLEAGLEAAGIVVETTSDALGWMAGHPCPSRTAGAELTAAIRVQRNAAFAYRGLAAVEDPDDLIVEACAGMLSQGSDHLRQYRAKVDGGGA
jgi:hypothetical protein